MTELLPMEPGGPKLYDITARRMVQDEHDTTLMEMAPEEIEDIERGFPIKKLSESEDPATRVTQLIKLKEGEEGVELWKKHSIYKVHAAIAAVNPEAFTPKVVSMGPYHHGKKHLMPMEVHKQRAARHFIEVSGKSIKHFIDGLWEVLPELMDSYSQLDRVWREDANKVRFLEMMLIDGCFLLEILRTWADGEHYDIHDPVFSLCGMMSFKHQMTADMMMLENQVPFPALEKLLTIQKGRARKQEKEIFKYIKERMLLVLYGRKDPDGSKCMHMLDVARHRLFKLELVPEHGGFIGANENTLKYLGEFDPVKKLRSVTELCRAGVWFRKAEDETIPLTSILFKNNEIIIPVIPLHLLTEVQGCNMAAFELIHPGTSIETLSYLSFMKGLLTSAADVRHLRTRKIIQSTESSDDAIVQTFKRFPTGVLIAPPGTKLYQVQDQLYKFYDNRTEGLTGVYWELFTSLMERYFKYPWSFITLVSATFLLILTMVQTYYTALQYWVSNHNNN